MDKETKREIILDNYQHPMNRGLKEDKSYIKANTRSDSCIDNIDLMMKIEDGKIVDVPIRYIMRHHTPKMMFKIKTKSGKETIVTEDHSCIVFRNGKQMSIKAKDINIKTDKILSLVNDRH